MNKYSTIIVGSLIFFSTSVLPVLASVSQMNFATPERQVAVGAVSDALTIQLVDSSGSQVSLGETGDLTFTSTSATGEFINDQGQPVTKTMNSNWKSRTFYYRDSTSGSATLDVKLVGRTTGVSFETSQTITVGSSDTAPTNPSPSSPPTSGDTTNNSAGTSADDNGSNTSAHASSASLSTGSAPVTFAISAGRERLAMVGNPLHLDAVILKGGPGESTQLTWNFGDGTALSGPSVYHSYAFPGTYEIVLNGQSGGEQAVTRTRVKVVASGIKISEVNLQAGYVSLTNNSTYEMNIGGWRLERGDRQLVLPDDTLIVPGGTMTVSLTLSSLNMSAGPVVLRDFQGIERGFLATEITPPVVAEVSTSTTIALLQNQIATLITSANTSPPANNSVPDNFSKSVPPKISTNLTTDIPTTTTTTTTTTTPVSATTTQVANVGELPIIIPKPATWYSNLKKIPTIGIDFVRSIIKL